jgi:hypothetical protein
MPFSEEHVPETEHTENAGEYELANEHTLKGRLPPAILYMFAGSW